MATLKELRTRIASVKSTQKITKAMQMVASSKLRRAQENAEAARPYAERMEGMLRAIAISVAGNDNAPRMLAGSGASDTHLLLVTTSDRGLCGGFNSSIVRAVKKRIAALQADGKTVKLLCLGRKGRDQLKRDHQGLIIDTVEDLDKGGLDYDDAAAISTRLAKMFDDGEFDVCTIIYNHFKSVMSQIVTIQQLIPYHVEDGDASDGTEEALVSAIYEYEPDEEEILAQLLPRNLAVQIYRALLESSASEQAARMTAMDNATRNAGDMIDKLSLLYNRSRQAAITTELTEIVTGAEAL
ncbi:MAG: F0F1 ATP synthase subunit gamma [Proteobacteria bacterium]|nr:F0F1 ATP synthase subunit gamma [Pseudomonadota bacterium]